MTFEAKAAHCTRHQSGRCIIACDPDGAFRKPRKLCCFSKGFGGFEDNALSPHFVVKAVDQLFNQNILENRSDHRFRVYAMPDQLDVANDRLDAIAPFLTPEVEPLS